jgi:hypothetical protein
MDLYRIKPGTPVTSQRETSRKKGKLVETSIKAQGVWALARIGQRGPVRVALGQVG